jgi:uncharacterized protein
VSVRTEAFFLPLGHATEPHRFCVWHTPAQGPMRALVLHAPAWADEMNKARRMVALQARALARQGFGVLVIDLAGCGDSEGEFAQARWERWLDDLAAAVRWLRERSAAPFLLWGLRAGCLLARELADRPGVDARGLLLWQPPASGKLLLTQFLRIVGAGQALAEAGDGDGGAALSPKAALDAGLTVEVAGYPLSPALAEGLARATLSAPARALASHWFEVSGAEPAAHTPGVLQLSERWQAAGSPPALSVIAGAAFWQTTEIEEVPALVEASVAAALGMLS